MKNQKIYISCTTDRPSASLTLDTARIGFPDSQIKCAVLGKYIPEVYERMGQVDIQPFETGIATHHADLLQEFIKDANGPLVILDGDLIFRERVDSWEFPTLLAGYYVPLIWNEFAQCVSLPRLHTSFLMIRDSVSLLRGIRSAYPPAVSPGGAYCPLDTFHPRVMFVNGSPKFWDTCCGLYQIFGGTSFNKQQQAAYTHLHSASFFDVMLERMENREGFQFLHTEGYKDPDLMRQYNGSVERYYAQQHKRALLVA